MSKIEKIVYGVVVASAIGGAVRLYYADERRIERRNNIIARVESYMENRPHTEFADLRKQAVEYGDYGAYMQSSLDSLAYREIFASSQAVADSVAVNEFNKLASSMRKSPKSRFMSSSDFYNNIGKMVTHKQFKQIEKEAKSDFLTLQFKADSVAYRRFFEKHGLLNDSTLKKFTAIAKKIRP